MITNTLGVVTIRSASEIAAFDSPGQSVDIDLTTAS